MYLVVHVKHLSFFPNFIIIIIIRRRRRRRRKKYIYIYTHTHTHTHTHTYTSTKLLFVELSNHVLMLHTKRVHTVLCLCAI